MTLSTPNCSGSALVPALLGVDAALCAGCAPALGSAFWLGNAEMGAAWFALGFAVGCARNVGVDGYGFAPVLIGQITGERQRRQALLGVVRNLSKRRHLARSHSEADLLAHDHRVTCLRFRW